jgi:hypothetical protein
MKKILLAGVVIAGAALAATEAQAVSVTWTSSGTGYVNQVFDPSPSTGLVGPAQFTNISLGGLFITTGPSTGAVVTLTYLGQESGYADATGRASFANTLLTEADAVGTAAPFNVAAGLTNQAIDFKFFDTVGGYAVNGGAWSSGNSIGLIGTNVNLGAYGTFDYVLGYNDSGTGHDDWDDFVIGVNVRDNNEVPEPATLGLLGLGLFGVGFGRRRK